MVLISFKRHGFQTTGAVFEGGLTYTLKADMSDSTFFDWKRSNKLDRLLALQHTLFTVYMRCKL